MDGQRFDELARLLGSGASRRSMLKLLGGGIGGALGGLVPRWSQVRAQCTNPETCETSDECCVGFECDPGLSVCADSQPCSVDGATCSDSAECCSSFCPNDACQTSCADDGTACTSPSECCSEDCINGVCTTVCAGVGSPCSTGPDCCEYWFDDGPYCKEGVCTEPTCSSIDCQSLSCCPGSWCVAEGQQCAAMECVDNGDCPTRAVGCHNGWCVDYEWWMCEITSDCDPGLECRNGNCYAPCTPPGEACLDDAQCCNGYCDGDICVECHDNGVNCAEDAECCSHDCFDGGCVECRDFGSTCVQSEQCCGHQCIDGYCSCLPAGGDYCDGCSEPVQCCSGEYEGVANICTAYACDRFSDGCLVGDVCIDGLCYPEPGVCASDSACGDGEICCGNLCRQVECCIDDVNPKGRCNDGQTCKDGVCKAIACAGEGNACAANADCCPSLVCEDGICEPDAVGCFGKGSNCATDRDCCVDLSCTIGICQQETATDSVTELPDAGVRLVRKAKRLDLKLPLAAGFAALFGGLGLRKK